MEYFHWKISRELIKAKEAWKPLLRHQRERACTSKELILGKILQFDFVTAISWSQVAPYKIQCTHRPPSTHRSWVQRSILKFQYTPILATQSHPTHTFKCFHYFILFFTVSENSLKSWCQWLCIPLRHSQTLANWFGKQEDFVSGPRKKKKEKKNGVVHEQLLKWFSNSKSSNSIVVEYP